MFKPSIRSAAFLLDPAPLTFFSILILTQFVLKNDILALGTLSYAFHFINLHACLFRRYDPAKLVQHALFFRTLAFVTMGSMMLYYGFSGANALAAATLSTGVFLQVTAIRALGLTRTYYATELGHLPQNEVSAFPYEFLKHPMAIGVSLQFIGCSLLSPSFVVAHPYLIPGHLLLTWVTAFSEHFDIHLEGRFFRVQFGTVSDPDTRKAIDGLREWAMQHYKSQLHRECSKHDYVKTLPAEAISQIDRIRYADEVLAPIRKAFPDSRIVPMPQTDEIYISRYNYDKGGDQGLFDKHFDGNLRMFPGASVVRSLMYLSSDDRLEVVFQSSGERRNMKTYDFGLLDFHKEFHWVDGHYDEGRPARLLLKCNYYVDHTGWAFYRKLGIFLNIAVFYVVKAVMEYSKSPKTPIQRAAGILANVFRRLNNVSPALPLLLILVAVALMLTAFRGLSGLF